jgi:predicted GTPase
MAAIPSAILISNLAAAQQSLDKAKQSYENWMERDEKNKDELRQALARKAALEEEWVQRENDVAEGTKNLQAALSALVEASKQAPTSQGSPSPKRLSKEAKAAMTPEQKKAHKAAKKQAHDERKANRTPEEQAKIDARVAKMQEALKASRAAKKAILGSGDEMPALVSGASV